MSQPSHYLLAQILSMLGPLKTGNTDLVWYWQRRQRLSFEDAILAIDLLWLRRTSVFSKDRPAPS